MRTIWEERMEETTNRQTTIEQMETTTDHGRLKPALGIYISSIAPRLLNEKIRFKVIFINLVCVYFMNPILLIPS